MRSMWGAGVKDEERNTCTVLVGTRKAKSQLGKHGNRCDDNL
jgi:hypothetical protein